MQNGLQTPQRQWATLGLAIGISLSVIDSTIINIALPIIARDFDISAGESVAVVNAYQLVVAMTLLPLAGLGDQIGFRRVYLSGFALFIAASLLCAMAGNYMLLVIARALQGLGAAGIMCVGTALVRAIFPPHMLGRGLGFNAMIVAGSTAAGPGLASAILVIADWHWFFLINVPFGLIGMFVAYRAMPENPLGSKKFDAPSAILSALTFGSMLYCVESLSQRHNLQLSALTFVFMTIVGTLFVRRQLGMTEPMLPVDLLVKPLFSLSLGAALCSFAAQMMTLVSLPFFFNYQLGLSEVAIGLLFIVWPLSVMFTAVAAGRLADHYPAGILGGIGLTLGACGLFLLYRLQADAQLADIIWRLFVCGAGFGLFQTPNMRFIVSTSPHHRTGSVSGMIGTVRLSGQTIGASLSALMLHLFREDHGQSALVLAASITLFAALLSSLRLSSHWANRP